MNEQLPIAIVGGGPAGAFAGELLAAGGKGVLLFDEKLAWEKPCGGGLTHKALIQYPFLGEARAESELMPLVYAELRRMARQHLRRERGDHTLQSTALVHEVFLRLSGQSALRVESRAHFFGIAASLMRQILVDHARARNAAKRGGGALTLVLDDDVGFAKGTSLDLIELDNAMKRLAELDARQCQIVELRFFGGLSIEEAARVVDISPATAKREWATARVWLHRAMEDGVEA